jgi:hypothetical protein
MPRGDTAGEHASIEAAPPQFRGCLATDLETVDAVGDHGLVTR